MSEHPISPRAPATPREEKLQAIAAVFGDAVAARLASMPSAQNPRRHDTPAADADRVAWQTNRLIQHLRARVAPDRTPSKGPTVPDLLRAPLQRRELGKIPALVEGEDLAAEHPAVIAHILRDAPQDMRVAVLRALPGQVARAVMRRLRAA
jgi:hypothetical protein